MSLLFAPASFAWLRMRHIVVAPAAALGRALWLPVVAVVMLASVSLFGAVQLPDLGLAAIPSEPDPPAESSLILDAHGRRIGRFHGVEDRIVIPLRRIPQHMIDATLAIEDHEFFRHGGIRWSAIARAALVDVATGDLAQGASTITQQYARLAFDEIGRERSWARKLREVVVARRLEREMSKEDILAGYLNGVYFGRGAYGVEAAARAYFGVPASRLRLHQSAFLAGIIQAPEAYARAPRAARGRRDLVLNRMVDVGFLDVARSQHARREPLGLVRSSYRDVRAPYFVEYLRRLLTRPISEGGFGLTHTDILAGGLTIRTTLDLRMQRAAERAFRRVLNRRGDPEGAMVAMTTRGEVRAMIGGRQVDDEARARGFNYAVQRAADGGRAAGSTFKPFTLAAYLARGHDPDRVFSAPSEIDIDSCKNEDGSSWSPENYGGQSFGSLNVVEATERSVNTVYAQLVDVVGPASAMRMARALGIDSPLEPVCSIALGPFGVTPLEMARAYATLAGRGIRPEILAVTEIVASDGTVIERRAPDGSRVLRREVADRVNAILERVVRYGTGTPARISRTSAGKTGTTESRRDLWYVGYTPHPGLVAAVWIGHPQVGGEVPPPVRDTYGRPATGGGFAGQIWALFMERAVDGMKVRKFARVEDVERSDDASTWDDGDDGDTIVLPTPEETEEPKDEAGGGSGSNDENEDKGKPGGKN